MTDERCSLRGSQPISPKDREHIELHTAKRDGYLQVHTKIREKCVTGLVANGFLVLAGIVPDAQRPDGRPVLWYKITRKGLRRYEELSIELGIQ